MASRSAAAAARMLWVSRSWKRSCNCFASSDAPEERLGHLREILGKGRRIVCIARQVEIGGRDLHAVRLDSSHKPRHQFDVFRIHARRHLGKDLQGECHYLIAFFPDLVGQVEESGAVSRFDFGDRRILTEPIHHGDRRLVVFSHGRGEFDKPVEEFLLQFHGFVAIGIEVR